MDVQLLWTTKDVAARLKVSSETVRLLSHRADFPEPVGRVGHIRVWRSADVEAWAVEHRPATAR